MVGLESLLNSWIRTRFVTPMTGLQLDLLTLTLIFSNAQRGFRHKKVLFYSKLTIIMVLILIWGLRSRCHQASIALMAVKIALKIPIPAGAQI